MIFVAAYCRVSTDKEDQVNSFEAQCSFFRDYIENHADWQLYQVYADEGITGTNTKKRTEFLRMMTDARERRFSLVITKEVSRFSRNLLDTIAYTRELKALGIGVLFVTDGIHTLEPDAELRLSIMASIVQEESRKTSCRVIWGQTRQMEKGVVFGRSLLGYQVKNGEISIEPDGAKTVRSIFEMYAYEQLSTQKIARRLIADGIMTSHGNTVWTATAVARILKNEKYAGDLIQKKTYTADYLTHERKTNHGEVRQVVIRDHHPPIVCREIWALAQDRLNQNNKHHPGRTGHSNQYAFSGKIRCGECGSVFVGRVRSRRGRGMRCWRCAKAVREGMAHDQVENGKRIGCDVGKMLTDNDAWTMLETALRSLPIDFDAYSAELSQLIENCVKQRENTKSDMLCLKKHITQTEDIFVKAMDSYFSGEITVSEMHLLKNRYRKRILSLQSQLKEIEVISDNCNQELIRESISALLSGQVRSDVFCKSVLDCITVYHDRHIELKLYHLPHIFRFAEKERSTRHA